VRSLVLRSALGFILLIGIAHASVAGIPTAFTRRVNSGHLIVDGRFIGAPFTLAYGLDPAGVYVGGFRVTTDRDVYVRLGYETEPPRVTMGGNEAWVGDVVVAPDSSPDRAIALRLAAQVTAKLAGWLAEGLDADGIEAEFGRYLFLEADVIGVDIQERRAELYLDSQGQTHVALSIDTPALETMRHVFEAALQEAAAAAAEGGVYVNGRRVGTDDVDPGLRRELVEAGDERAARWLRALWGESLGPRTGASAVRGMFADVAIPFGTSPDGAGVLVIEDDREGVAVFSGGAMSPRVFDALSPFISIGVAPSARDSRVRVHSAGFTAPGLAASRAAEGAALRIDGDRVVARYRDDELDRSGRRLWRSESPMPPSARWSVPAPRALLLPVPDGVVGVRWDSGRVRWRLGIGEVTAAPVMTPDGKVAFLAEDGGSLTAVEIRQGRVLWSVYPQARQATLLAGMPTLTPLAASNDVVLVARGDDEILVIDRGSAAIRARHEVSAAPVPGVGDRDLLVAVGSRVIAFDRDGSRTASRAVDPVATPRSLVSVGDVYVLDDDAALRVLGRDLVERRRLPYTVWSSGEKMLVVAGDDRRVDFYADPVGKPVSVELAGRPAGIVVADRSVWVVCEGGLAYGVDPGKGRVRRTLDMEDVAPATIRNHGVGAIAFTEEASLTGWKIE
jgi:outer membrane protein assembly factor BamB